MSAEWLAAWPGVRRDEPLARHSQFGVGGPADWFLRVDDLSVVAELVARCTESGVPLTILGAGSNALILDGGIRGLARAAVEQAARGRRRRRDARRGDHAAARRARPRRCRLGGDGVGHRRARQLRRLHLGQRRRVRRRGGEQPARVRGGRARRRHAVARRGPTAASATATRASSTTSPATWSSAGASRSARDDRARCASAPTRCRLERKRTQPYGVRSLGSTFKNPPGDFAGRLIEAAGLAGRRHGGAQISPKHANFILNVDHATAADVLALVERRTRRGGQPLRRRARARDRAARRAGASRRHCLDEHCRRHLRQPLGGARGVGDHRAPGDGGAVDRRIARCPCTSPRTGAGSPARR